MKGGGGQEWPPHNENKILVADRITADESPPYCKIRSSMQRAARFALSVARGALARRIFSDFSERKHLMRTALYHPWI